METFTATLYWPDIGEKRYQDEERLVVLLGPDGTPPAELRVGAIVDGHQVLDVYILDTPYDLPLEVYYKHVDVQIRP